MQINMKVKYDDGREVDVVAKPKDIVAFERQYDVAFVEFYAVRKYEWLCYLAWSPLNRQGRETSTFDAFMDVIADVSSQEEETEDVPFDPALSEEPSPA